MAAEFLVEVGWLFTDLSLNEDMSRYIDLLDFIYVSILMSENSYLMHSR